MNFTFLKTILLLRSKYPYELLKKNSVKTILLATLLGLGSAGAAQAQNLFDTFAVSFGVHKNQDELGPIYTSP